MQMPAGRLSPPGRFLFGVCFLQREWSFRSNSPCVKLYLLLGFSTSVAVGA